MSLGRSLRLWRIIGRFFLTLVTLYLHDYPIVAIKPIHLKISQSVYDCETYFVVNTSRVLLFQKYSPFTCAHEYLNKFAHAGGASTFWIDPLSVNKNDSRHAYITSYTSLKLLPGLVKSTECFSKRYISTKTNPFRDTLTWLVKEFHCQLLGDN